MSRLATLLASAVLTSALVVACAPSPGSSTEPPPTPIQRGEYLVSAMGCHDCHTPWVVGPNGVPEPDMTRALSGHPQDMTVGPPPTLDPASGWLWGGAATNTAFYGPWGVSYSANITSAANNGLGIWTEDMFLRAIREGKHMGTSREILPPMPWPMIRNLNDDDLKSIFAYLKSTAPIENRVPEPVVAMPPAGGQ